jgi:nicotinamide-nucleotide amidase
MFPERLRNLALLILDDAEQARLKIATAESCTGGLLAALFTEIPGSSSVFERGFVTYSNRAKEEMLGVPGDALADYGAVSEPVAPTFLSASPAWPAPAAARA